mgnify:CR=1 FL=1
MSLPASISRTTSLLSSQLALGHIGRTGTSLLRIQEQISTGRAILRPSDDSVKAATIGTLDDRIERSTQITRNLSHAEASLGVLDSALEEANTLALQARSIASDQVNLTASSSERAQQAIVIDQMLRSLFDVANQTSVAGYIFGGNVTSQAPVVAFNGGYRFRGDGAGLTTDLGPATNVPITLGQGNPLVSSSIRVRGTVDLNPSLTTDTRLTDVRGARGLGVRAGSIELSINSGQRVPVDLTDADTVQDVADRLEAAIRRHETDTGIVVLGPSGVATGTDGVTLDIASGTIDFLDVASGVTAADLGLSGITFSASTAAAGALDPRLSWTAPITSLAGVTGPLGSISISNLGRAATIDLSSAATLQDLRNAIEAADVGVRVVINDAGTGIDVLNDASGASSAALSIAESNPGTFTATRLGIRSFIADTRIDDFNFGRGVSVVNGVTNPVTGTIDRALNTDLRIRLGDAADTTVDIDLRPQDMITVQTVIDRINAEAAPQLAAAGLSPTAFSASISPTSNGIAFTQTASFTGTIRIEPRNNSGAAEQLGLTGGSFDAASATFTGQDRARVRIDSLFTHLMDLRDALRANDVAGIGLAGSSLETSIGSLAESRGMVGSFAQRVESAIESEEDRRTLDDTVRSSLRDTDYAQAATRFSLLQTQLEASIRVTSLSSSLSLLDFIS